MESRRQREGMSSSSSSSLLDQSTISGEERRPGQQPLHLAYTGPHHHHQLGRNQASPSSPLPHLLPPSTVHCWSAGGGVEGGGSKGGKEEEEEEEEEEGPYSLSQTLQHTHSHTATPRPTL